MEKPRILVLIYSTYGHIYKMSQSVIDGIIAGGGEAVLMQVQELIPEQFLDDYAKQLKLQMKDIPFADPRKDLAGYDGYIIGTPTRFGNMASQMKNFWDQTAGDWMKGTLIGKPAAFFTSTATQHGGQETTLITSMIPLLHHGCVIVGLPYSNQEQMTISEMSGGSPYGASTIAGGDGSRQPSENELVLAKALGKHLAEIAGKLK